MRSGTTRTLVLLTLTSCYGGDPADESLSSISQSAGIRGAVFTTLEDGSRVNHNIYGAKEDVYLDGGPSGGSPSGAAALAEGDYYFQVTDPSGKTLLSQDAIECRRIHVSDDGVITAVIGACTHDTGVDEDYASLGAITVQLMPYADTPNPGGEYKVWVTPVDDYLGSGRFHGFVPSQSKTDNFKVREVVVAPPPEEPPPEEPPPEEPPCPTTPCPEEPPPPPPCCGDGHVDAGEECDDGNTTNGDGCSATCKQEELPPPPKPCCGDGHVDSGEQCDDGNTTGGDGCSSTCQSELSSEPEDDGYTPPDGAFCSTCVLSVGTRDEYGTLY